VESVTPASNSNGGRVGHSASGVDVHVVQHTGSLCRRRADDDDDDDDVVHRVDAC